MGSIPTQVLRFFFSEKNLRTCIQVLQLMIICIIVSKLFIIGWEISFIGGGKGKPQPKQHPYTKREGKK